MVYIIDCLARYPMNRKSTVIIVPIINDRFRVPITRGDSLGLGDLVHLGGPPPPCFPLHFGSSHTWARPWNSCSSAEVPPAGGSCSRSSPEGFHFACLTFKMCSDLTLGVDISFLNADFGVCWRSGNAGPTFSLTPAGVEKLPRSLGRTRELCPATSSLGHLALLTWPQGHLGWCLWSKILAVKYWGKLLTRPDDVQILLLFGLLGILFTFH